MFDKELENGYNNGLAMDSDGIEVFPGNYDCHHVSVKRIHLTIDERSHVTVIAYKEKDNHHACEIRSGNIFRLYVHESDIEYMYKYFSKMRVQHWRHDQLMFK